MSIVMWLFVMALVAFVWLKFDPITHYWNWVATRAHSMKTSTNYVRLTDAVVVSVHMLLWVGVPSALFMSPPTQLTVAMGLPDKASDLWFWTLWFVVALVGDTLIVSGMMLLWGQLTGARAMLLRRVSPLVSRLVMFVLMLALLGLVYQAAKFCLAAILAASPRTPNYDVINLFMAILGVILAGLAVNAPVAAIELEGLTDQLEELEKAAFRIMTIRQMVASGQYRLPAVTPVDGMLRVPQDRMRKLLAGADSSTRSVLATMAGQGLLLTDPDYRHLYIDRTRAGTDLQVINVEEDGPGLLRRR